MSRLRRWLLARRLIQRALDTPVEPHLFRRPPPRVMLGLIFLGASYVLGWPAVIALAALASRLKQPKLLLVGPPVYGFSWLLFVAGLALIGKESMATGRALGLWLARRFAEKFLVE